jgi:Replication-relaxation
MDDGHERGASRTWQQRQQRGDPRAMEAKKSLLTPTYTEELNPSLPRNDGFGLRVGVAHIIRHQRQADILRLIGHIGIATAATLHQVLYYPRYDMRTTYRDLNHLVDNKLLWQANATARFQGGRPERVYFLSYAGKDFIARNEMSGMNVDQRIIASKPQKKLSVINRVDHDIQVSWWCASMIEGLRLIPWCSGIYVQAQFRASSRQVMDALIVARFNFSRPREQVSAIPWFDGRVRAEGEVELCWALEIDDSSESIPGILDTYIQYRDHHSSGTYHTLLQNHVLPVTIAQNSRRAAMLAAEFSRAWPEGWGLVSTPDRRGASSNPYGALWGRYADMNSGALVPLMSRVMYARGRPVTYQPVLHLDVWEALLRARAAGVDIQSLADLDY